MLSPEEFKVIIKRSDMGKLVAGYADDLIKRYNCKYEINIREISKESNEYFYLYNCDGIRCTMVSISMLSVVILRDSLTTAMDGFIVVIGDEEGVKGYLESVGYTNYADIIKMSDFIKFIKYAENEELLYSLNMMSKEGKVKDLLTDTIVDVYSKDYIVKIDLSSFDPNSEITTIITSDTSLSGYKTEDIYGYCVYPTINSMAMILAESLEELAYVIKHYDLYKKLGGEYIEQDGRVLKAYGEAIINFKYGTRFTMNK